MKLRKPCPEHNRYESHTYLDDGCGRPGCLQHTSELLCPGGVFLPDDTLVIEDRVALEKQLELTLRWEGSLVTVLEALDALSVREAE